MIKRTEKIEKAVKELLQVDRKKLDEATFENVCLKYEVDPDIVEVVMFGKSEILDQRRRMLHYILNNRRITSVKATRLHCYRPRRRFEELKMSDGIVVVEKAVKRKDGSGYLAFELYS